MRRAEAMVAQIAHCDPSQAAHALDQAAGDVKTAVLLALGVDKARADTVLKKCDGNLRRVFAELSRDGDERSEETAARKQGGAIES